MHDYHYEQNVEETDESKAHLLFSASGFFCVALCHSSRAFYRQLRCSIGINLLDTRSYLKGER